MSLWPSKFRALVLAGVLCAASGAAFAQGCVMCYSTTAASPKDAQRAISRAVILLLVPPLGMMSLGIGLAFRYSHRRDLEQERDSA
jgi:hypothetical protein